jgi:hypothetical protein
MDDASQFVAQATSEPSRAPLSRALSAGFDADATRFDDPLPAQSIHFAVPPSRTLTWRVTAPATLRTHAAQVWITRARSPYDHWVKPGETLRLERGERIWISTDAEVAARVMITSAWRPPFAEVRRGVERLAEWLALLTLRRSRQA